jgi:hypothetical protein
MKKVFVGVALLAFVTVITSSCHRHGSCPAYGSVDVEKVDKSL